MQGRSPVDICFTVGKRGKRNAIDSLISSICDLLCIGGNTITVARSDINSNRISGIVSLTYFNREAILIYLVLAVLCIAAAITYTVGKNAYGYRGLGDIMVFIFFGLVSVIGVFGLYGEGFEWLVLFPAISMGAWSTAVLNLNNLRDISNDAKMQKRTMVVQLGFERAKLYHVFLVSSGLATWFFTVYLLAFNTYNYWLFGALLPSIGFVLHLKRVLDNQTPAALDPELKKVALLTFFSALLFAILLNFAPH